MTRRTLTCVIGLFLASTSCGGSDETKPVDAAIDMRGTGGRAGAGGAGGSGGRGGADAAADVIPPIDVSTADTSSADGSDGGSDAGLSDTSGSDGGDARGDARIDTNTTPDAPVTVDTAPDTTPPVETAPITVTACNQIACPDLMNLVTTCNGSGSDCTQSMSTAGQVTTTNYCHDNGVKKTATSNTGNQLITMRVKRSNGSDCYTLEMTPGTPAGTQENWVYKSPSGTVLGTAVSNFGGGNSTITLRCNGGTYVINTAQVDCAGTDGQPGPGECANGACTP